MTRGGILTVSHDILVVFEFMEIILLAKSLIADLNMQIKFSILLSTQLRIRFVGVAQLKLRKIAQILAIIPNDFV